jgi:hypothetical protein
MWEDAKMSDASVMGAPAFPISGFVEAGARAGIRFDQHLVALRYEFTHPSRSQGDAVFIQLYFLRNSDAHSLAGQRKFRNVVINLPPRHMKSALASILYPAWRLGCDPTVKFICISYGDDLAHDLSAQTRKILHSPFYKKFFPEQSSTRTPWTTFAPPWAGIATPPP